MLNVLTGRGLCACINATTREESIPPERKAPNGTSATICWATDSRDNATSRSLASSSSPSNGWADPASATVCSDQYCSGQGGLLVRIWASVTVSTQPGSNL